MADKDERKVDLGIGAYRTDEGKPLVLKPRLLELRTPLAQLLNRRLARHCDSNRSGRRSFGLDAPLVHHFVLNARMRVLHVG